MPIDAAEFDAHKNINTVIIQFLRHNKDKGFSAMPFMPHPFSPISYFNTSAM
jgi:hypothetical protein